MEGGGALMPSLRARLLGQDPVLTLKVVALAIVLIACVFVSECSHKAVIVETGTETAGED